MSQSQISTKPLISIFQKNNMFFFSSQYIHHDYSSKQIDKGNEIKNKTGYCRS